MSIVFTIDPAKDESGPVHLGSMKVVIDRPDIFVGRLDATEKSDLVRALVEAMAADAIIDALADDVLPRIGGASQLGERGTLLMDCFVERARLFGRLPQDWEPQWVSHLRDDAGRLQTAICEGRTDDAMDLLHGMVPDNDFLSPAAEKMMAGLRGRDLSQGRLL